MRGNFTLISLVLLVFLFLDIYVFQGIRLLLNNSSPNYRRIIYLLYWSFTIIAIGGFLIFNFGNPEKWSRFTRTFVFAFVTLNYFSKLFAVFFLLLDDVIRIIKWGVQKISLLSQHQPLSSGPAISRSEFLVKTSMVAGAIPFVSMAYGIISGAHDYRVKQVKIALKNLPKSFEGLKIAQISDIHSGSFYNKYAVKRGVDLLMKQNADMVFFTGDLVNNEAKEMLEYTDVFSKISAPMGVYSVLGNHDYGDYKPWPTNIEKVENLNTLKNIHKKMGWDLLMNEHRIFERNGEKIAVIGIENFGAKGRFPKYGRLDIAHKGTQDASVKLLLSHDPSHWDFQVIPEYKDIDVMFAGHTHGFQFGVELGKIKWSPVKYVYDQWAGLYQKADQYLYVNRGFGFIGFPGRIGMPPEITLFEFSRA